MKDLKYIAALKSVPSAFNDVEIGPDGDLVTVEGTDRIKQDVVKILMTESGLLPYPNYGTSLPTIPGSTPFSATLLNNISSEVIAAVHYLVLTEESQLTSEQIDQITKLEVTHSGSAINLNMEIATKDKASTSVGFTL